LCDQLKEFFLSQAKIIIKPKLRKGLSFKTVYEIDLINESTIADFFMSSQECLVIFKEERFKSLIKWDQIPEKLQKELAIFGIELILELLHKLRHYLPLKDEYIDSFKVLEPKHFDREAWKNLANKFPLLILRNSLSDESLEACLLLHENQDIELTQEVAIKLNLMHFHYSPFHKKFPLSKC